MSTFTLASFNICSAHFMEQRYTDKNLQRLADMIVAGGADVVALQEVDRGANRSNGVDMAARLSDLSGLAHHYFIKIRDFQGGEYGTAILSRYPIVESQTLNFPVQIATQGTSCGWVKLDVEGKIVTVFNTHLSVESEEANTETLCCFGDILQDYMAHNEDGCLACGDFNTLPAKVAEYLPWIHRAHDGLVTFADRSIDHIIYADPIRVSHARTMDTQVDRVTDHNMLLVEVTV